MRLLSALRLGVNVGLLEDLAMERVNELFVLTQPGHLQKLEQHTLDARERDAARAAFIRSRLA